MKNLYLIQIGLLTFLFNSCNTGYKKDDQGVYFEYWNESSGQHKVTIDADPKTTVIYNESYAKDNTSAFYRGKKMIGADPGSFEGLSELYARDQNSAWYTNESIKNSNGKTFQILKHARYYAKDDKNIFYTDEQIPGADVPSFEVVDEKSDVSKDKNSYYYCSYRIPVKDYMTFEQIKGDYWKDKYHVYDISRAFYGEDCILTGVDPQTAKAVRDRNYIRDKYGKYPR